MKYRRSSGLVAITVTVAVAVAAIADGVDRNFSCRIWCSVTCVAVIISAVDFLIICTVVDRVCERVDQSQQHLFTRQHQQRKRATTGES